ncbi:hypothetical protein QTP86_015797, partial [Hemibagrus guttatus]
QIRVMEVIVTINITCEVILSANGYTYPVSPNISSDVLQDQDCEQTWYRKALGNGSEWEYLSDGQLRENQTKHKLVVAATRKNITVSECIELRHDVTCHGSNQKFRHVYQGERESGGDCSVTAVLLRITALWEQFGDDPFLFQHDCTPVHKARDELPEDST